MATGLLDGLNAPQRDAITTGDGPVLVLAGPGSGKTRVLTHRVAYLVREMGIHPSAIMAVTFTNKAAGEMRARAEKLLGGRLEGLQIGTFHAICARLLRREAQHTPFRADYLIYDTDDQVAVVTQALNELNIDQKKFQPRRILYMISAAKNELITPEQYQGKGYTEEIARRVYGRYDELLMAANARDFDDLLLHTVLLMRENDEAREKYQRFIEYLLVDEFQDTNTAQYELVRLIGQPQNNVFVVGDEDQAIYGFRGADYRNVMRFRKDYPDAKVILLEQNYRSTQIVLDAARAVIDKNAHRTHKALFTDRAGGPRVTVFEAYSEVEEADFVVQKIAELRKKQNLTYQDFAVMYRTNAQSRALEEACLKANIPYKLVGGIGFYKRREIRDLLAYLRLVNNANDSVSFNRIINVPKRGIGKKSLEDFQRWAVKNKLTYSEALEALRNGEKSPITGSAVKKFADFAAMLADWRALAQQGDMLVLFDDIVASIGYMIHLHEISNNDQEFTEREENIRELRGLINQSKDKPLNEFLEDIALVADVDTLKDDLDAVTLLTLHAAKGLEYPVVFITGLEEGVLPHFRSLDEADGLEEERRLMYVGLTRAKEHVFLAYAFRRLSYGGSSMNLPSRFLTDIPDELMEGVTPMTAHRRERQRYEQETTWDWEPSSRSLSTERAIGNTPPVTRPTLQFQSGIRVYHGKFGEGVVIESRRSGQDEEVTVAFEKHGIKRLAASFANLVILKE
jgi:DNA helicase-2/ATP-dependent DNA helicase PcrA